MRSARLMLCAALAASSMYGQLTYERLLKAESEPQNWLTYSGSYKGWRYSKLDQINRRNVKDLKLAWAYQMPTTHRIETTPLVVDGVMYITEPPSNVIALDPATGRQFWRYKQHAQQSECLLRPGESRRGDARRPHLRRHSGC